AANFSGLRPTKINLAPVGASSRATSAPRPDVGPVMTSVFPVRSKSEISDHPPSFLRIKKPIFEKPGTTAKSRTLLTVVEIGDEVECVFTDSLCQRSSRRRSCTRLEDMSINLRELGSTDWGISRVEVRRTDC
ncbi:MAG: hypothetical protein RL628_1576, partial [Actinomycetota bacterium]